MRTRPAGLLEAAIPDLLREMRGAFGDTILLEVSVPSPASGTRTVKADLFVDVTWSSKRLRFAAEAKARNTQRIFDEAVRQARDGAKATKRFPMVVLPYLSESRLDQLEREEVSGLDLCGNGLLIVPGQLLVRRGGRPNRYPESQPARFAYRGATSLIPRVFLRRPEYPSISAIGAEIAAAGAQVALSTVSKALARMTEDVLIDRRPDRVRLVQADKLLDLLRDSFTPPRIARSASLRWTGTLKEFFDLASRTTGTPGQPPLKLAVSGASSHSLYSAGLRAETPLLFTSSLRELERRLASSWSPSERFSDLRVSETDDMTVYFDTRSGQAVDDHGVRYASPVQTYLELATTGDKRDEEIASQVRELVLRGLNPGDTN